MMNANEIVRELRWMADNAVGYTNKGTICRHAADLIESLQAQLAEVERRADTAVLEVCRRCPTVDAVPVVRGEWIENPTKDSVLCSYCHADWNLFDNDTYRFCYCPNCGARMEDKPCG